MHSLSLLDKGKNKVHQLLNIHFFENSHRNKKGLSFYVVPNWGMRELTQTQHHILDGIYHSWGVQAGYVCTGLLCYS